MAQLQLVLKIHQPSEGISTLADYIKYDNVLIAGENGVKSDGTGETNVIAGNNNYIAGTDTGILSDSSGTITVTAGNNNYIGQYTDDTGTHTSNTGIKVTEGTVNVTANNNNEIYSSHDGIYSYGDNNGKTENKISLTSNEGSNIINTNAKGSGFGIYAAYTDEVKLTAKQDNSITLIGNGAGINSIGSRVELIAQEGSNKVSANGEGNTSWGVQSTNDGYVKLDAEKDNEVSGVYTAILAQSQYTNNESKVVLVAGRNNNITADEVGIQACFDGNVDLTAETGNNIVKGNDGKTLRIGLTTEKNGGSTREEGGVISLTATANNNEIYTDYRGIDSVDNGQISLSAGNSNFITGDYGAVRATEKSIVSMSATNGNNTIISVGLGEGFALEATSGSTITANAAEKENKVVSDFAGIYASGDASQVSAIAGTDNIITADSQNMLTDDTLTANYGAGNSYAVYSEAGAAVNLQAANANKVSGAVYANGSGTDAEGNVVPTSVTLDATENNVYSAAVIDGAGGLAGKDEDPQNGLDVVSALYAENGAKITVSGNNNFYTYYSDPTDTHTSERVVWAYDKANINIDGYTNIGTTLYNVSPNSKDIAIAAGTAVGLNEGNVNTPVADVDRATVTLEYDDSLNGYMSSNITGDILSAYAGLVNIKAKEGSNASINITGNLLSGNNGKMTVNLGNGGRLTGRIDDYGDAGTVAENGHLQFFDPAFSSDILTGGEVNLEMGNNSYWNVTGQSWVTSLSGEGSIIDMRNDNENLNGSTNQIADENTPDNNSHAVHIGTLTGSNTFVMDLNDNSHSISDMLYIKDEVDSSGTHTVFLNSIEGLENMQDGDKLRFATVNAGAEQLAFVGDYKGENGYTGSRSRAMLYDVGFNDVAFEIKNEIYSEEDTENEGYNGEEFGETKPGNDYVDAEYGDGATNWYLTRNSSGDEISDGGKTILNMSRANYSNAIYMDRLNKRLGEARYINSEEEDGMWVRIRHDRIGKTDAYRSQNTMYELGYDKKQDCDNGERRVGFAVDYMHGDTGYSDIAGKGEIDRYGLWLYDTWMGNKGHYVDYVAKWGHLSNDFEIYNSRGQVTGDYSNNVFSISAEYGRKKDMGNDWYIEPQAQLQLARVTGADYVTSQGTKVSVDGINSLIGRAGFRLGKDFGEEKQSTVYIKADVLHEFLGDQTIRALDGTTGGDWQSVDYENKGTWYDIGIGYAAMLSQSTYAFIDLEQSFGNDNDDTYQINAGVRWTF